MYGNNIDPKLLAQNPTLKKIGRIIGIVLFVIIAIEIGLLILVSSLLGDGSILNGLGYVFGIFILQAIIGYSIKPLSLPGQSQASGAGMLGVLQMDSFTKARKFAGTLLMIPGFLTDIAAIIILIPPFRKGIVKLVKKFAAKKVSKMTGHTIDPEMLDKMSEMASKMGPGAGAGNPFGGFGGMGNGFGGAGESASSTTKSSSEPAPGSRKDRRRQRKQQKETTTVDVDYEIRDGDGVWVGGHSDQPTDLAVSMKHKQAPRHDDEDVIDVEADWK